MKIGNSTANNLQQAQASQDAKKAKELDSAQRRNSDPSAMAKESVKSELSGKAKELARTADLAKSAPDIRAEKIAELRERIAKGEYNVKPEGIADRMVDDHLRMEGIR